jgi:hypothetical protein
VLEASVLHLRCRPAIGGSMDQAGATLISYVSTYLASADN